MEELKNKDIINKMSLKDKVRLCSGEGFWSSRAFKKYGIEDIFFSDGPHGLRKQDKKGDQLGINNSIPATCFPSAALCSSTWNVDLIEEMARAIGQEALEYGVDVVLGPGVNIKRNPLCGRNFEYFSEDPYLSGKMGASWIKGVQSVGVGASLKHFACNNMESERFSADSIVDERTLREIYLLPFEIAVKEGGPDTVMASYNKVNGTYLSDNYEMLNEILRKEWGFKGVVVTDWGAMNDKVAAFKASLDLEMPTSGNIFDAEVVKLVGVGQLKERYINEAVDRIIELVKNKVSARKKHYKYSREEHHKLAQRIAEEGAVLLKNVDNILPIKKNNIALIGDLAKNIRFEGEGSSFVNPTKLVSIVDGFKMENINHKYFRGYGKDEKEDKNLLKEAINGAKESEMVVLVIGLPDYYECEGLDRSNMKLPENQLNLLREISKVSENIVVVLLGGSPVEMEWESNVKAILNMYLGGQAIGEAVAKILIGKINPSGKLAETYPIIYEDNPSAEACAENPRQVQYREGVYVGYRYYDKSKKAVRFPFGFGLSYTAFQYSNIKLSSKVIKEEDSLKVSCKIKNIGSVFGKEVVELYVGYKEDQIYRPIKELKAFAKVSLDPKEEREVTFSLNKRDFSYYDVDLKKWTMLSGDYEILIGSSSRDIRLKETVEVIGLKEDRQQNIPSWYISPSGYPTKSDFEQLYGKSIEEYKGYEDGKYDLLCSLSDMKETKSAKIVMHCIKKYLCLKYNCQESNLQFKFMNNHLVTTPLKRLVQQHGKKRLLILMNLLVFLANR